MPVAPSMFVGETYKNNKGCIGKVVEYVNARKVKIINMHTEYIDVNEFCLSICQAWTTDCDTINTTKDFEYSVKEKIIFKTGKIYLEKARYIDKMKSRFPDYLFFEVKPL